MSGSWEGWPQEYWSPADWKAWEKAGRPYIPPGLRMKGAPAPAPPLVALDQPQVAPAKTLFPTFSLHEPPQRRGPRTADGILEAWGIRPRVEYGIKPSRSSASRDPSRGHDEQTRLG